MSNQCPSFYSRNLCNPLYKSSNRIILQSIFFFLLQESSEPSTVNHTMTGNSLTDKSPTTYTTSWTNTNSHANHNVNSKPPNKSHKRNAMTLHLTDVKNSSMNTLPHWPNTLILSTLNHFGMHVLKILNHVERKSISTLTANLSQLLSLLQMLLDNTQNTQNPVVSH